MYSDRWWSRDVADAPAFHYPVLGTMCPANVGVTCYQNSQCPWSPMFWKDRPERPIPEDVKKWWDWCARHGVPISR